MSHRFFGVINHIGIFQPLLESLLRPFHTSTMTVSEIVLEVCLETVWMLTIGSHVVGRGLHRYIKLANTTLRHRDNPSALLKRLLLLTCPMMMSQRVSLPSTRDCLVQGWSSSTSAMFAMSCRVDSHPFQSNPPPYHPRMIQMDSGYVSERFWGIPRVIPPTGG